MTSESSPHRGWSPSDRNDPADEALQQRGFGTFDAPSAPEEFPVFTPYSSARDSDFPPDSDGSQFGGFPSDDLPMSDSYVPAPAVLPIPGVRHEADPLSSPLWSAPEVPEPEWSPPSLDADDPLSSRSWSAFAAGQAPKADPVSAPWDQPAPWEPASSWEKPAAWTNDVPSAHYSGTSGSMSSFDAPADPPAPVSPPPPPPMAPPVPPLPPATAPAIPPPPMAASGVAQVLPPGTAPAGRASVSVPMSSRVDPAEAVVPPPVAPQQRPAGRVYGTPASQQQQPQQPMQPDVSGVAPVPAQRAPEAAPAAPTATARASVNVARPQPGEAPPPITRSSTVYGSPTATAPADPHVPPPAQAQMAPPLQQRGGRQPFGDLLDPSQANAAPVPMQRPASGVAAVGQPHGGPGDAHRAVGAATPLREPDQARFERFKAPDPAAAAEKPERKGRIILGVLVGCVALLAVAFGVLILADRFFGPSFAVGDCVKQGNGVALSAGCDEEGAFVVKSEVGAKEQCEDQTMPHVEQGNQILCLAPAVPPAGAEPTQSPTQAPTSAPTASPTP